MNHQLPLLDTPLSPEATTRPTGRSSARWRLDARTRRAGKAGLADARRALAEATRRSAERSAA